MSLERDRATGGGSGKGRRDAAAAPADAWGGTFANSRKMLIGRSNVEKPPKKLTALMASTQKQRTRAALAEPTRLSRSDCSYKKGRATMQLSLMA